MTAQLYRQSAPSAHAIDVEHDRAGGRSGRATASSGSSSTSRLLSASRTRTLRPQKSSRAPAAVRLARFRLAHLPGDPAVSRGAARLLSAWRTRSLRPQKFSSAPAAVRLARFRLAHLPGDPAVSPGAARLLSAWRTSSLKSDESSSAATARSSVPSSSRIARAMQFPPGAARRLSAWRSTREARYCRANAFRSKQHAVT